MNKMIYFCICVVVIVFVWWVIPVGIISFVKWRNLFVFSLYEWHEGARFAIVFWWAISFAIYWACTTKLH